MGFQEVRGRGAHRNQSEELMKRKVLVIETSTKQCSVALFLGNECMASARQRDEVRHVHAEELLPLIDEVMRQANWERTDLEAVAVSAGPGSYTGLRIGVATAKGICHALSIPLLAIDTLELAAHGAAHLVNSDDVVIWPVLDARRMEVYVKPFRIDQGIWAAQSDAQAVDLEVGLPAGTGLTAHALICVGDAADKVKSLGVRADAQFLQQDPDAVHASALVERAEEVDLAYFEPRYLKAFQPGVPKDPLGLRAAALDPPSHA
jgi:tRNA threonylcarbamoyladenosine biosynthesis protein TsaB